jgi:protease IV
MICAIVACSAGLTMRRVVLAFNTMTRLYLLAIVLAPLAGFSVARAENNFALRDVGRGVAIPTPHGLAGDFDATATRSNPAGLATLGGFSLGLGATRLAEDRTVRGGGGWGAFVAVPLTLRLREGEPFRLSYGFAWEQVQAPDSWLRADPLDTRADPYDASLFINSVGVGTRRASFGWSIVRVNWADSPESQGTTTHHIGAQLHPSRFLALGAAFRDVFEPAGRTGAERFVRSIDAEVAARPLGDWRVELAAGAIFGDDGFKDLRGRALLRPLEGITLFGHVESVQRRFGTADGPARRDLRVLAGLAFDLRYGRRQETAGAAYGTLTSQRNSGNAYAGSGVFVHSTDEAFPSLIEPARFERIEIAGERDEREHVRTIVRMGELERMDEVRGLVLELSEHDLGWGRTEELRERVAALRKAGKMVITYLKQAGMRQYYLAAAGDRILLHPAASIELRGIAALQFFARAMIEKIGVSAQVSQIAEYKSAGEIFTRTGPSEAAREQTLAYIGDIHARFLSTISQERGLSVERLAGLLARPALTPAELVTERLVDEIVHDDVVEERVGKVIGRKVRFSKERPAPSRPTYWDAPEIAVVHVSGEIVDAPEGDGLFAQQQTPRKVAEAIRDARESGRVRAIILRVNSPGGMVQPSELIAREVELTRGKKPILVSMADLAASGGYWVAAPADAIYASPSTLTGSIGVVSVRFSIGELAQRIGISSAVEKTSPHADAYSPFRPFSPEEMQGHAAEMHYIYDRFLDRVAAGRRKPRETIDPIARGRIWSGQRALDNGLVDHLAGLGAVIKEARRRAGVSDRTRVNVVSLPPEAGSLVERLIKPPGSDASPLPAAARKLLSAIPKLYLYPSLRPLARAPWAEAALGIDIR